MRIKYLFCFFIFNSLSVFAQETEKEEEKLFGSITPTTTVSGGKGKNKIDVFLDSKFENYTKFTSQNTSDSKFRTVQSRVYVKGTYDDKLTYSLRYRLNESVASKALEFAFLEYNINDNWTVSAGKQFIAWGSTELSYNSAELYMFTNIIASSQLFSPGASVTYKRAGQSYKLQVVSQGEQFVAEEYKNKAYGGLFLWEGELFNKHLKTRYGYGLMQHDAKKYYSWITIGNRLTFDKLMVEMDWVYGSYNLNDVQLNSHNTDTGLAYVRDNVTSATFKYKTKKLTPIVKAMYNYRSDLDNNVSYALSGVSAAVEYYPFEKAPFQALRLYAAYNFYNYDYKKYDIKPADKNEHQIALGVRWMIPLF